MNTRRYQMSARAASAAATADRILDAATARYAVTPYERLRLEDVAADAGVTVQTVLRRFGSKAQLLVAVAERGLQTIAETRATAGGLDPAVILHDLVAHYRRWGALIIKVYAEAPQIDGMSPLAASGRSYHVQWCRAAFEPHLPTGLDAATRDRRRAQVVAVCDATTWRILAEDHALDDDEIELALAELLLPLLR